MKNIIAFNTIEDIWYILGLRDDDNAQTWGIHQMLWSVGLHQAGFDFDNWDIGFACKEPLRHTVKDGDREYTVWDDDVWWLGMQLDFSCFDLNECEYGGYHWYTAHT